MPDRLRVTVWGENVHERKNAVVRQIYPDGMHNCIAAALRDNLRRRKAECDKPSGAESCHAPILATHRRLCCRALAIF